MITNSFIKFFLFNVYKYFPVILICHQTSGMVKEVNIISIKDNDETDAGDTDPGFGE